MNYPGFCDHVTDWGNDEARMSNDEGMTKCESRACGNTRGAERSKPATIQSSQPVELDSWSFVFCDYGQFPVLVD
jgi:hypothetical protein